MKAPSDILRAVDARIDAMLERPANYAPGIRAMGLLLHQLLWMRCLVLDDYNVPVGLGLEVQRSMFEAGRTLGIPEDARGPFAVLADEHGNESFDKAEVRHFFVTWIGLVRRRCA